MFYSSQFCPFRKKTIVLKFAWDPETKFFTWDIAKPRNSETKQRNTKRNRHKKFARLFRIVPELSKKIFWRNFPKLLWGGGRSDYGKFLLDSIFPTKLTEFVPKLTEFVPFTFIISQYCPTVKRILPDWLCLPNKLGGAAAPLAPPPPGTPMDTPVPVYGYE
jgi:hypothetical protein